VGRQRTKGRDDGESSPMSRSTVSELCQRAASSDAADMLMIVVVYAGSGEGKIF
jgi:hypothetical protein